MMIWAEEEKLQCRSKTKSLRQRDQDMFEHLLLDYELLLNAYMDADGKDIITLFKKLKFW